MPAEFDGLTLHWVDLDIDIRCYLDGSIRVLDEDEFRQNRDLMSYPEEVVDRALAARDEILNLAKGGDFPFDHEVQIGDEVLER
jgi:protein associated with RNAse G/E